LEIFLFTIVSRTALGPTQPPIQWVSGALSVGVKRQWREADHSSSSTAEVKECMDIYLHSLNTPSWRGAHLKKAQGQLQLTFYNDSTDSVGYVRFLAKREFKESSHVMLSFYKKLG
jgi:hypothetical protein